MKRINFVSHILPHIIAVLSFFLLTLFFFNPIFFDNKAIEQHDIQMWEGSAKALIDYREKTGEEGLWAPSMFSGMPAYLINVIWSNGPVVALKKILTVGLPHPVANIFAALISYYIMLLAFRIKPFYAIAGAIAFAFSTFVITGLAAGHNGRIGAIAFMPLVMAGAHLAFTGKRFLGFAVTTAGMALHLRENHLQITYYLLLIVLVYGLIQLIEAIRQKQIPAFAQTIGVLLISVVIGTGTFMGQLWAISEYSHYSMRGPSDLENPAITDGADKGIGKTYAFHYSNGIWEPMTLLVPNIYGGSTSSFLVRDQESNVYQALVQSGNQESANRLAVYTSAYWGPQGNTAPYYAGAIICFLFIAGALFADKKYVWWLVPLGIVSVMMSWGDSFKIFNYFLFDYLPGYNKFRSVTFTLVIILFSMPLLGLMGMQKLFEQGWNKTTMRKLIWPVALTAGVCLILGVTGGFGNYTRPIEQQMQLPDWFLNALRADRIALLREDAWRSFWFIVVFVVALYARLKSWINDSVFALAAVLLITIDLTMVDRRFFTADQYKRKHVRQAFQPTEADQEILRDQSYYRVYNINGPFNEAQTSYFHNSIGGYHGAKIKRYMELYDSCIISETQQMIQDAQQGALNFRQYGVLNMLNVKYVTFGDSRTNILPNLHACGPAWFVQDVVKVTTANEELALTCDLDTRNRAVINTSGIELPAMTYDSAATIALKEMKPNIMTYESESIAPGLAVFSEIYYPKGWVATIDGQEAPILRANFVLRALAIPEGKHTIVFTFRPDAYFIGNKVTMASSWIMLLLVIGSIGWSLKKETEQ